VALKSRCAAISDTYANQGARAGAILPFTSALSGLCAATTVAVVEVLPFLPSPVLQCLTCVAFPGVGAIVAAAASISKARCEVDAAAATAAAAQIARVDEEDLAEMSPVQTVLGLIRSLLRPATQRARSVWRRLRWRVLPPSDKLRVARAELEYRVEMYDADADGRLSREELRELLPLVTGSGGGTTGAQRVAREASAVAAADGTISYAQLCQLVEVEWRRHGPPAGLYVRHRAAAPSAPQQALA